MVCGNLFGETRKHRYSSHSSSDQHRATQNKTSYFARSADEMDWEQSQTYQAIRHLTTNWHDTFKLFERQNAEVQRHLQAGHSNLEHMFRKVLEDFVANGVIIIQSPHSPDAPTKSLSSKPLEQRVATSSELYDELQRLTLKLQNAEEELTVVKSQLDEAELRTDQLRKLIISAGTEPILDSKIQQKFSEIRTLTQKVVSKLYTKTPRYWESLVDESRVFFEGIKDRSLDLRQDAIHGQLFHCLQQWFFSDAIKDHGLGDKYEKLQTLLGQANEELVEAIEAKGLGGPHGEEIREWRNATLKCINLLQDPSNDQAFCVAHIENFFKPAETDDSKAQQRGRKYLQSLCERSSELGALMRRTEDSFEVFTVKDGIPLADCEDIAEKWINYSDKDASGVEITASCLFGGLRKISKDYPTKPVVLEKAQVATRFVRHAE
ncbi:uncharacterized protein FSUBG_9699 [Fusarium subglutinans]|uniref:Uncharacterized protein n=1 Tax=Gibberella subglutinans TaxID=42677 RepID=A0A8H5UN83_GIBSU|nr:uncharacterized protein FSUBG_9699 [Fusarium subglutinans]KAF5593791.1 hypothetical protein FSUBG_9699 [Fusarium subglutinans]